MSTKLDRPLLEASCATLYSHQRRPPPNLPPATSDSLKITSAPDKLELLPAQKRWITAFKAGIFHYFCSTFCWSNLLKALPNLTKVNLTAFMVDAVYFSAVGTAMR